VFGGFSIVIGGRNEQIELQDTCTCDDTFNYVGKVRTNTIKIAKYWFVIALALGCSHG